MMKAYEHIQKKLSQFVTKYYTNELIKGAILFFSIGLLYFIITLLVEHFLWLSTGARTALFWIFIAVELSLFAKFIVLPLTKLFKLQQGISFKEASTIIGNHFPEVNDKLLNVLQLSEASQESELLLASIEQKSKELQPIPFQVAINFKKNIKYAKYALLPLAIVLFVWISGNSSLFSQSYERVVNYKTAYEPPAPFQFIVVNDSLQAIENQSYTLKVQTLGDVIPEEVQITVDDETYFLQNKGIGTFEYTFTQPKEATTFTLNANEVTSKPYTLDVVKVPSLVNFQMVLDYPAYTKRKDEVLQSTGNATIPEGTKITWQAKAKQTNKLELISKDSTYTFAKEADEFKLEKSIFQQLDYQISTSNDELQNYENLGFNINVIRDEYPKLELQSKRDSIDGRTMYFLGQVSDDYGLKRLQLVYYPAERVEEKSKENIPISTSNIDQFQYTFPGNLELAKGVNYEFYFELTDNDGIRGGKKVKSEIFNYRKLTDTELQTEQLQQQNETIKDLDKSLEKLQKQQDELKKITQNQKEKSELNFNDRKKLEKFLQRQEQSDEMMKKFSEQLEQNLEEFQKEETKDDVDKELLKERLERQQKELEKNEKLMEELKKLAEKISEEELQEKLEELGKQQQNIKKNLQQILELTKRYYVTKKAEKIQRELQELAKEQEELSKKTGEENTKEKQEELNKKFEDLQKQMDELDEENNKLKKPLDLERSKEDEEDIKQEQQDATDDLEKSEESKSEQQKSEQQKSAQQKQKKAAQKMQRMSKSMQSAMQMSGQESIQEDAEMLRQILDNLLLFSFDEENLMNGFKEIDNTNASYAAKLKRQKELRKMFEHVDDSLFALSLRQPTISERINGEITEIYYNIDKSLEQLAENNVYRGVASQQYALTSTNKLADFLSEALDNMNQSMGQGQGQGSNGMGQSGQNQGQGKGFQLPDIIQSQEDINKQMQQGMKQEGQGKDGKDGKEGGKEEGDKGKGEKEGKDGENGKTGGGSGSGSEYESEKLYDIYKQQQQLRNQLEQQLKDKFGEKINDPQAVELLKQMEEVETELLERGFNDETMKKMIELKYQLQKLDKAAFEQEKESKRESTTNRTDYNNTTNEKMPDVRQYFNQIEILNRQVLPLRNNYKKKVQEYFKKKDD
ncbi:hypothetical protein C8N46_106126 [Kordia periserrulae]|uniref:Uncharacterized protein n=1 Tax=Kordia periserrulae TaxID=701523 RepID=A0A2T6BWN0_9FLAO|nr:DUF4175 family protein [Kordia periserrulae]PTX60482.1 hypothetical protein C8N46_106126 [Kordia periserrulae]